MSKVYNIGLSSVKDKDNNTFYVKHDCTPKGDCKFYLLDDKENIKFSGKVNRITNIYADDEHIDKTYDDINIWTVKYD